MKENPALWTEVTRAIRRGLQAVADLDDSSAVAESVAKSLERESLLRDGVDPDELKKAIRLAVSEWNGNPMLQGGPTLAFHVDSRLRSFCRR